MTHAKFLSGEMSERNLKPLHSDKNEKMLLHGTKPEVVASILEQSLDPQMAADGLFGRGTYFAEHPVKINQYVTQDEEFKGGARENKYRSICKLHNKLYPRPDMHPGRVYYALVCRVILGSPDVTKERKGGPDPGHHSLLALASKSSDHYLKRYREFVMYDRRAIKIEYLVAYTRTKQYCGCGTKVRERTIPSQNHRSAIACDNSYRHNGRWVGGCSLFSALPRCYCKRGNDFYGAERVDSMNLFRCLNNRCDFRCLINQGVDLREAEDSPDEDKYDSGDSFLAPG